MIYHVIVNPAGASGRTGKVWNRIEPIFQESGRDYEVHCSTPEHGVGDICRELDEAFHRERRATAVSQHKNLCDSGSAAADPEASAHSGAEQKTASEAAVTGGAEPGERPAGPAQIPAQDKLVLITVGGDGSVNEAMNGISDPAYVLYGHIPAGSGNDIIRDMNLPKKPEDVARRILEGKVCRQFDVGELVYVDEEEEADGSRGPGGPDEGSGGAVFAEKGRQQDSTPRKPGPETEIRMGWAAHVGIGNARRFAISCGIGFDAGICEMAGRSRFKNVLNKIGLGKLIYIVSAFRIISGQESRAVDIIFDGNVSDRAQGVASEGMPPEPCGASTEASADTEGVQRQASRREIHYDHLLLLACMNHQFEGGGFQFAPDAAFDDGVLNLCVADPAHNSAFYKAFPFALFGKHYRFDYIHAHTARTIEVRTEIPMWVHTDGEVERMASHIRIRTLDSRLDVLE